MKIKQIDSDFGVNETYNLEQLKLKENNSKDGSLRFYYFILTKTNYTVNSAIEQICRTFKIQIRDVHFAGTKDRHAVTTQLISLRRLRKTWKEDVEYFNNKFLEMNLEFVDMFPSRLNLGDNTGNAFNIVVRDVTAEEIKAARGKLNLIKENGVPNYFDSQRFGYAGNNHIVGKHLIKAEFKEAFFEIILSAPVNAKRDQKEFVKYVIENKEKIIEENDWEKVKELCPYWLRNETRMIEYVMQYKNDFLGAISLIPKKIRTMYVNAYQSYIFNETIKFLKREGKFVITETLPLVSAETDFNTFWGEFVLELMNKDGIKPEDLKLASSPTLRPREVLRGVKNSISNLVIGEGVDDDLNSGKMKVVVSFELGRGSYATNVVTELF